MISVIVPCYNQAQYLEECLNSVYNQTFTDWECIIVNDGSPDNTEEVAKRFEIKDLRFKYIKKENGGLSSARNAGIRNAAGKYILPLDADDFIGTEYLQNAVNVLTTDPTIELVYCKADYFGEKTGPWKLPAYSFERLLKENLIFCTCFYSRDKALEIGLYDEGLTDGLEDWEFLLRLLDENSKVCCLNETLFYYRIKKISMVTEINKNQDKTFKVKHKIYTLHGDKISKHYGDWINLIEENERLRERIIYFENFIPGRSLKNLMKFLKKKKIHSSN